VALVAHVGGRPEGGAGLPAHRARGACEEDGWQARRESRGGRITTTRAGAARARGGRPPFPLPRVVVFPMPRATSPSRAALAALRLVQNNTLCALRRRKARILRRLGRARAPDNGARKFTRSGFPRPPSLHQRCPCAGLVGTRLFVAGPRNGYSLDAGRLEVVEGVLAAQGVDLQGGEKKGDHCETTSPTTHNAASGAGGGPLTSCWFDMNFSITAEMIDILALCRKRAQTGTKEVMKRAIANFRKNHFRERRDALPPPPPHTVHRTPTHSEPGSLNAPLQRDSPDATAALLHSVG
jgi:hypothetical protein